MGQSVDGEEEGGWLGHAEVALANFLEPRPGEADAHLLGVWAGAPVWGGRLVRVVQGISCCALWVPAGVR